MQTRLLHHVCLAFCRFQLCLEKLGKFYETFEEFLLTSAKLANQQQISTSTESLLASLAEVTATDIAIMYSKEGQYLDK